MGTSQLTMRLSKDCEPDHETERSYQSRQVTRRLLDAAVEVFGVRGYEAARIPEISRRCGKSPGAIYGRWFTKRDLFLDVVAYVMPQRMVSLVGDTEMPASERLAVLGANLMSPGSDRFRDLTLEAIVAARRDEALAEAVSEFLDVEADTLAALVTQAKQSGSIDASLSTEAIVFSYQALGLGVHLATAARSRNRPPPDEWITLITRIIEAMGAPRSDSP